MGTIVVARNWSVMYDSRMMSDPKHQGESALDGSIDVSIDVAGVISGLKQARKPVEVESGTASTIFPAAPENARFLWFDSAQLGQTPAAGVVAIFPDAPRAEMERWRTP
ncbi:MAG: hypothetical protein ACE5EU_00035 [Paracoccaceae bacterium]